MRKILHVPMIANIPFKTKMLNLIGGGAALYAGYCSYYVPHTALLFFYRDQYQIYKNMEAYPVQKHILNLQSQVMEDLKIPEKKRGSIHLFISSGFRTMSMGSIWSMKWVDDFDKAIIGIPASYTDINFACEGIKLNGDTVNWYIESGQNLKASLLLSDKAKKFALAQQTHEINTPEPLLKSIITGTVAFSTFLIGYKIKYMNSALERSRTARYIIYFLITFCTVNLWLVATDLVRLNYEGKSDRDVAALGQHYIEGGIEYYNKALQMNMCLREILNGGGYTLYGNKKSYIRQKHLELTSRRDFMTKKLKELSAASAS